MLVITLAAVAAVFLSVTVGQAPNPASQGAAVQAPIPPGPARRVGQIWDRQTSKYTARSDGGLGL